MRMRLAAEVEAVGGEVRAVWQPLLSRQRRAMRLELAATSGTYRLSWPTARAPYRGLRHVHVLEERLQDHCEVVFRVIAPAVNQVLRVILQG